MCCAAWKLQMFVCIQALCQATLILLYTLTHVRTENIYMLCNMIPFYSTRAHFNKTSDALHYTVRSEEGRTVQPARRRCPLAAYLWVYLQGIFSLLSKKCTQWRNYIVSEYIRKYLIYKFVNLKDICSWK